MKIKPNTHILAILCCSVFFIIAVSANAHAEFLPVSEKLCGPFPCPAGSTGTEIAKSLVGKLVDNVRFIIGAIAVAMIIVAGIKLITAGGNEEEFTKQEKTLLYAIIGLFFVGLAGELATIFEVGRGGFLKDPNVMLQKSKLFTRTVEIVITLIKYLIGSIAVLFVVRSSLRLVIYGGNEEETVKDKKNILYGMLGLIVILISHPIITKVFFKIDTKKYPGLDPVQPGVDPAAFAKEIAGITNIVAAITGPFALLSLVIGGLMYVLAGGDEEKTGKAKKIIIWSIVGIIIIYGSFAIVSTFVARRFEGI